MWKTPNLLALVLISFVSHSVASHHHHHHPENSEEEQSNVTDDTGVDPWETPLQELLRNAPNCSHKVANFFKILSFAHANWQSCIDTITSNISELTDKGRRQRHANSTNDSQSNSSYSFTEEEEEEEIENKVYLTICYNTNAYKQCWSPIIAALNICNPGIGTVSGSLYFALYDDICREGGRITIEHRKKATDEGKLCNREYSTTACIKNKELRNANDLCSRFESNVECDLSSIDPNCSNKVDQHIHRQIFDRVRKVINCDLSSSSSSSSLQPPLPSRREEETSYSGTYSRTWQSYAVTFVIVIYWSRVVAITIL